MRNLLADLLYRRGGPALVYGLLFAVCAGVASALDDQPHWWLSLFAFIGCAGGAIEFLGEVNKPRWLRVVRILPMTPRQVALALWLAAVPITSAIGAAILTLAFGIVSLIRDFSFTGFSRFPLLFLVACALSGSWAFLLLIQAPETPCRPIQALSLRTGNRLATITHATRLVGLVALGNIAVLLCGAPVRGQDVNWTTVLAIGIGLAFGLLSLVLRGVPTLLTVVSPDPSERPGGIRKRFDALVGPRFAGFFFHATAFTHAFANGLVLSLIVLLLCRWDAALRGWAVIFVGILLLIFGTDRWFPALRIHRTFPLSSVRLLSLYFGFHATTAVGLFLGGVPLLLLESGLRLVWALPLLVLWVGMCMWHAALQLIFGPGTHLRAVFLTTAVLACVFLLMPLPRTEMRGALGALISGAVLAIASVPIAWHAITRTSRAYRFDSVADHPNITEEDD